MGTALEKYTSGEYFRNNPSWDLEDSPWKAKKVAELLATIHYRPKSICEVGCGAGGVLAALGRFYPDAELFGYEVAREAEKFWGAHQESHIQFAVGDFFELNRRHFDLVLLVDVIEHLENPFEFLRRLRAYGDIFVFHIPLDLSATNVLRESPLLRSWSRVGHLHYFTKGLALAMIRECAYHVLKSRYTEAAFTGPKASWKTWLSNVPRFLAYTINKDAGVRLMGGETLMVLARAKNEIGD